jgi:hypothetical protein
LTLELGVFIVVPMSKSWVDLKGGRLRDLSNSYPVLVYQTSYFGELLVVVLSDFLNTRPLHLYLYKLL